MRNVLIALIVVGLLFLLGDQLTYEVEALIAPERCGDFQSAIMMFKELGDGRVSSVNGVVVGAKTVLTVSHGQPDMKSLLLVRDDLIRNDIEKVETDTLRDLVLITTKKDLGLPIAFLSSEMKGPFTLVTLRANKIRSVFAGINWVIEDGKYIFPNGAAIPGDSGAALLNYHCEVVAVVHGGNSSFLWHLKPTSVYNPLFK